MEASLGLFLLSAVGISLTGVMLPGPMTAATIAKGYSDKNAGILIAAGHAVVEMPLIAAIYLGFADLVGDPQVVRVIHVAGGLMLFYLGFRIFRSAGNMPNEVGGLPSSSLLTGIVLTGANPGFYVWWVTVGISLVVGATTFGLIGIFSFALAHWSCDLGWSEFLSVGTFKSRRWWTQKVQRIVFGCCAFVLIGFGVWFCLSAFF
jgi:threonine/homoserine/homoserine lactone efflux protein